MRIKVQTKLVLFLSLLIGLSLISLMVVRNEQVKRSEVLRRDAENEKSIFYNKLINLKGRSLEAFVNDYAYWDEMACFAGGGGRRWAAEYIDNGLSLYDVTAAWVYTPDFSLAYSTSTVGAHALRNIPVSEDKLRGFFDREVSCHFFAATAAGLMEIRGARIRSVRDTARLTRPRGFLFAGRLWDTNYFQDLSFLAEGAVELLRVPGNAVLERRGTTITSLRPLPGPGGIPLMQLAITSPSPLLEHASGSVRLQFVLVLVAYLVILIGVSISLVFWVGRPLSRIAKSLSSEDPALILPLVNDRTEFGHIAQLIRRFFEQKEELVREVHERKRAQEELQQARQKLIDAKRLSDIGALAATVAHELRNPLSVMRLAAHNIRKKAGTPDIDAHLVHIESKIQQSERIIQDLLFYSRIRTPSFEPVKVEELLKESLFAVQGRFSEWKVVVNIPHILEPGVIQADAGQLTALFSNIITNAFESFPDRKGILDIQVSVTGDDIVLRFRDNGSGIAIEELNKVFNPFYTTKSAGTGLGLTVCYQIVDLHKGSIDIASEQGKGTTVRVCLPSRRGVAS